MTGRNPWVVLGVAEDAPYHEVQVAFRRRVKQTHPDGGGDAAEFAVVVDAFEVVRRAFAPQPGQAPAPQPRRVPARPTPYDRWLRPCAPVRSWSGDRRTAPVASGRPVGNRATARLRPAGGDFATVLLGEMSKARAAAVDSTT
jgi:hypothetical protein